MKDQKQNFMGFFKSPLGTFIVVVVLFYIITFAVYYFYSPGPQQRQQALLGNPNAVLSQQLQNAVSGNLSQSGTTQQ